MKSLGKPVALTVDLIGLAAIAFLLLRRGAPDPASIAAALIGIVPACLALAAVCSKNTRWILLAALTTNLILMLGGLLLMGWVMAMPGERRMWESVVGFALVAALASINLAVLWPRGWDKGAPVWWQVR